MIFLYFLRPLFRLNIRLWCVVNFANVSHVLEQYLCGLWCSWGQGFLFVWFPATVIVPYIQKALKIHISLISFLSAIYIYKFTILYLKNVTFIVFFLLPRKYKLPWLYFQSSIFILWLPSISVQFYFSLYFYLYMYLIFTPILKPKAPIFISCLFVSHHQIVHKCLPVYNCRVRFILFSLYS